jgi:uracil-DNA glycosylase
MLDAFCPGYGTEPFRSLCGDFPGPEAYPPADFRTEWGPIFHRGRLDGSARLLVIGQDPGQNENVVRRILVGVAGQRAQGFLAKLGLDRSYVMLNAFLYSMYGTHGAARNTDPAVVAYRHRWLEALLAGGRIEAVVTFGALADRAWRTWREGGGAGADLPHAALTHPTQPEASAGGDAATLERAMRTMLRGWNDGLALLRAALAHPDRPAPAAGYGEALTADDLAPIPAGDLPPGLPAWMRTEDGWAQRVGDTARLKRATIRVTVPDSVLP